MNKDVEEIRELADRIDHEELWRRPGMDILDMTPEEKDRLMAGVYLRRHASGREKVREALKEGAEFIRGHKFIQADDFSTDRRGCGTSEWHRAINSFDVEHSAKRFMYTAKMISNEVPRMILLFERERKGLPETYKMCAHDPRPPTDLPDNHLKCTLGKQTRNCPYLACIESNEAMTDEAKDEAKAWTCATHILLESKPDRYFDGLLYDKSDEAFDHQLMESLSLEPPEEPAACDHDGQEST